MIFTDEFLSSLGVVDWGYTEEDRALSYDKFEQWVSDGHAGSLNYLTDHRKELRQSLKKVYSDHQSTLVFLFDYKKTKSDLKKLYKKNQNFLKLSAYVLGFEGRDYHIVLKERLNLIKEHLLQSHTDLKTLAVVDTMPVLERDLAYRAGLGWFGKNSMLISKYHGSYFMIGSILLNKKINTIFRQAEVDHCGNCRACLDACPTQAFDETNRTLVADKCISTFTIEVFKDMEPPKILKNYDNEIFGCDICQEVCPWNKKHEEDNSEIKLNEKQVSLISFFNKNTVGEMLAKLSNQDFKKKFRHTPLERTGKKGILKNIYRLVK